MKALHEEFIDRAPGSRPRPTDEPGELLRSLVDLAETFNSVNLAIRRETSRRAGQSALSNEEVAFLAHVMSNADSTIEMIAAATGHRPAVLVQCGQTLQRRGLIAAAPDDATRFRVTPAGVALRATARERATHHVRYALAGLTAADRAELERASHALAALGSALGYQGLHHSYDDDRVIPPQR